MNAALHFSENNIIFSIAIFLGCKVTANCRYFKIKRYFFLIFPVYVLRFSLV